MSNTIREEFEEYLDNLVNEITCNILLDDMEELYNKYSSGFSQFEIMVNTAKETDEENRDKVASEIKAFQSLQDHIRSMIKKVDHALKLIDNGYQDVFKQFSARVHQINEDEKKKIAKEINDVYDQKIKALKKSLQEYDKQIQSAVKTVDEAEKKITQEYRNFFVEYSKDVQALNDKERSKFSKDVQEVITKEYEKLKKVVQEVKKENQKVIEKVLVDGPLEKVNNNVQTSIEKIDQLGKDAKAGKLSIQEMIATASKKELEQLDEMKEELEVVKGTVNDQYTFLKSENEQMILLLCDIQQQLEKERERNSKMRRIFAIVNGSIFIFTLYSFLAIEPWEFIGLGKALLVGAMPFGIVSVLFNRESVRKKLN